MLGDRRRLIVLLALLSLMLGVAHAEPNGQGEGERERERGRGGREPTEEHGGLTLDPAVALFESLILDVAETPPAEPATAGNTCDWSGTRLTAAPNPGSNTRVAFVYILPTTSDPSWSDSRLDEPRVCSGGNAYSALDHMYRNIATFMANELSDTSDVGARRLFPFTHTYSWACGVQTCSKSLYAAYLLRTTNTLSYWNNLTPAGKLSTVRAKLINAGFNHPNVVYVAILHARQQIDDPDTSIDDRQIVGLANTDGAGTSSAYAYVLRNLFDQATGTYPALRFGCASSGDQAILHEASHVLSAVPPDAPNEDGGRHMTSEWDVMYRQIQHTIGGAEPAHLDWGNNDYRVEAYTNGYTTSATSFVGGSLRTC